MEIPRIVVLPVLVSVCCVLMAIWLILRTPLLSKAPPCPVITTTLDGKDTSGSSLCNRRLLPYDTTTSRNNQRNVHVQRNRQLMNSPHIRGTVDNATTTTVHHVPPPVYNHRLSTDLLMQGASNELQKVSEPRDGLGPGVPSIPGIPASAQTTPRIEESPWVRLHKDDIIEQRALAKNTSVVANRAALSTPHAPLTYTTRLRRLTFQSAARDTVLYPSPAYYRMNLAVVQRNVIGIGLNLAVIPVSEFNVNIYTQWLDIEVAGVVYSVKLPEGNYVNVPTVPANNFSAALEAAIVATSPVLAAYTVTFNTLTLKVVVDTNGAPCSLRFGTGPNVNRSLWEIMGFPRTDTANLAVQEGVGTVNLAGALAIDLFIEEISNAIDATDNAFARIDLNRVGTNDNCFFTPPGDGLPRYFWPIGRLTFVTFNFKVRWTELLPDGTIIETYRPYLFNERQHTLRLDFVSKEYKSPFEDSIELEASG